MKTFYNSILLLLSLALTSCAQDTAQVTFHVRDDAGNPITNSTVEASTFVRWVPGGTEAGIREFDRRDGKTDTNGSVTITIPSKGSTIDYWVKNSGSYSDQGLRIALGDRREYYYDQGGNLIFTNKIGGKWQPWNPTVEVQVKPVLNPIPMYAKRCGSDRPERSCQTPELGKVFGFDLMESDWVSPHGKGKVADFLIRVDSKPSAMSPGYYERYPGAVRNTDVSLSLSFANPDDGIQSVLAHPLKGSSLRLPRFAPETGYQTNYTCRSYIKDDVIVDETDRPDQNYFFRVRSKRDEKGNLAGALYGKIYGSFKFPRSDGKIEFQYFLNPTPLDRNMEFDLKKNLLKDLTFLEQPKEP